MAFDWILFLGISLIGPYFGGKVCAALDKRYTGKVRHDPEFRNKRAKSALVSIAASYIVTVLLKSKFLRRINHYPELWITALTVLTGVLVYLLIQKIIYQILIFGYRRM
jgi:hypothetical protein